MQHLSQGPGEPLQVDPQRSAELDVSSYMMDNLGLSCWCPGPPKPGHRGPRTQSGGRTDQCCLQMLTLQHALAPQVEGGPSGTVLKTCVRSQTPPAHDLWKSIVTCAQQMVLLIQTLVG